MTATLEVDKTIRFYDWAGGEHKGKVKDFMTLSDDFGDFYLVLLDTGRGSARFEIEDYSGVLIGELWNHPKTSFPSEVRTGENWPPVAPI